jgi:hypothetical protein
MPPPPPPDEATLDNAEAEESPNGRSAWTRRIRRGNWRAAQTVYWSSVAAASWWRICCCAPQPCRGPSSSVTEGLHITASHTHIHCRKSYGISSSPSDISVLFHKHYTTNISEKYFPLYVLMSFQKCFGYFRTSTFRDIWRKIPRFMDQISSGTLFFISQYNLRIFRNISRTINFGTFPSI